MLCMLCSLPPFAYVLDALVMALRNYIVACLNGIRRVLLTFHR